MFPQLEVLWKILCDSVATLAIIHMWTVGRDFYIFPGYYCCVPTTSVMVFGVARLTDDAVLPLRPAYTAGGW